jgi:hypothetical protein
MIDYDELASMIKQAAAKGRAHRVCKNGHLVLFDDPATCYIPPCRPNERRCVACVKRRHSRSGKRWRGALTHCKNGHEFTPENTYYWQRPNGSLERYCRTCRKEGFAHFHEQHPEKQAEYMARAAERKQAAKTDENAI